MDNKIRILHVVGRMDRGGTEALLMNLLHEIVDSEFQYDFVEQTQDLCDYDQEIQDLGSKIYRVPHISVVSLQKYRSWWRKFFLQHPEYKIIHGHSRGAAPIYLDEANKAGRITILHCHNNSYGKGTKGIIRYIWQLPLRKLADYNLACSYDSGISQFGKKGKFEVVKNGIKTELFSWNPEIRRCVRKRFNLEGKLVIGNVARFEEQKNHPFLLKIFYEVHVRRPDACLMLVGQGSKEESIRRLSRKLGIEDKIIFTGVRSDVNELMQAMDIFVLPSHFEGLGIVNIEAQAAGLPCFVSDKVVPKEVKLTKLLHYISLSESPECWAQKILDGMIEIEERKDMSNNIKCAGFDIETTAKWISEFYEGILKNE